MPEQPEPKTFLSLDRPSTEEMIIVELNGVRLHSWRRAMQGTTGQPLVAHNVKAILTNGTAWQAKCDREFPTVSTITDSAAPRCPGCYKAMAEERGYEIATAEKP